MSWRTFDHGSDKFIDYPLKWNNGTLEIDEIGIKSNKRPPLDPNKRPKNPNDELENVLIGDGRQGRKVISINNHVSSVIQAELYPHLSMSQVVLYHEAK